MTSNNLNDYVTLGRKTWLHNVTSSFGERSSAKDLYSS